VKRPDPSTDWLVQTIARCRTSDAAAREQAWHELLTELVPHARRIASHEQYKLSFHPDRGAVEEATSEALLSLYRRFDTITDASGLMGWLTRVIQNKLRDFARKQRASRLDLTDDMRPFDTSVVGSTDLPIGGELYSAICKLTPTKRNVIFDAYWLGLSVKEIAQKYGIPEGTVKSRLSGAYSDIRTALWDAGIWL